jgi:hypothetical protein
LIFFLIFKYSGMMVLPVGQLRSIFFVSRKNTTKFKGSA